MAEKSVSIRLGARVDSYIAAMKAAQASTTGFSRATQRNLRTVGTQMQGLGRTMTTFVSLPIAAAGAFAVKAAVDWESAWAGVTKTVDGTAEQLAGLEQGLRDMSKELPATHGEIAAVAEAAGALGVATEDIEFFTRTMIDLGETTDLTSDQAATAIAQMMNVMQTAPGDVDNLASALVHLGNNGASTESQILDMATRIAASGAIVGLSEAEVLGFANALASMGIEAEAGGSAFSRVIQDIGKAVSQGGDDLDTFARVAGVSATQFAASFGEDPASAIVSFVDGLGRIHAAGGDVFTVLDDLGLSDVRVSRALLSMATSGDLLTTSLQQGEQAWEDNTALADEAAKRYDTAAARFEMVRNKIVDLFIDLGNIMLPVIEKVVDAIGVLAEAFQDLPQPLQMAVGGFLGLVAAAGPMLFLTGSLVKNFTAIRGAMTLMGPAATKAATGLGAIGLVAAAAGAAYLAFKFFTRSEELATTHIDTASTALHNQTVAAYNAAVAAGQATTEVDALAIAHLALANAISEAADDELNTALATLNITSEDTLDVLTRLGSGSLPTIRAEMDSLTARYFNLDAVGARWVNSLRAQGTANEDIAAILGTSVEAVEAWDNALGTTTGFADHNKEEINDLALAYLNLQARIPGASSEALLAAEAIAGNRNEAMNAIPVYEEYVRQVLALSPAQRDAVMSTDGFAGSINELIPGLEDGTFGIEGFGEAAKVAASSIDTMSDQMDYVSDLAHIFDEYGNAFEQTLGPAREWIRAHDSFSGALLGFNEQIEDASAGLDFNTEAGLANRDMVFGLADELIGLTESNFAAGKSQEETNREYLAGREALLDAAEAAGLNREDVEKLISAYGLVPDLVTTTVDLANDALMKWRIDRYIEKLDEVDPTIATAIEVAIDNEDWELANSLLRSIPGVIPVDIQVTSNIWSVVAAFNSIRGRSTLGGGWGGSGSAGGRFVPGGSNFVTSTGELSGRRGDEVILPLGDPGRMASLLGMSEVGPRVAAALGNLMPAQQWGPAPSVPAPSGASYTFGDVIVRDRDDAPVMVDALGKVLFLASHAA